MATPRTIALPWRPDGRGGLLLTATRLQGLEATRQVLMLSLLPPGQTRHPWLQNIGFREEIIFDRPDTAEVDILARLREIFARHRAAGRARLVSESVQIEPLPGAPTKRLVRFSYEDLRRKEMVPVTMEVGR